MKRRAPSAILVAVAVVLLLGIGAYAWFFWSPAGTVLSGPRYEGLLIPGKKLPNRFGRWTPTRKQIAELEAALVGDVRERDRLFGPKVLEMLPTYRRNYQGGTLQGRQLVIVDFYAPEIASRRDWLNSIIIDGDWGERNWEIQYDPLLRAFTNAQPFEVKLKPL